MLPRYMVRSHMNQDHVFCAVSQSDTHKIVKVQLHSGNPGKVEIKDIHVLITGMVAGLESDPENPNCIYLIDDYQNVFQIYENSDQESEYQLICNLSPHSLDDELKEVKNTPWATLCLSKRAIQIENYCFSMMTQFYWKIHSDNTDLLREHSITGAMYNLQRIQRDDE